MKVKIEIDPTVKECEVLIKCAEINDEVTSVQKAAAEIAADNKQIIYYHNETEYYFPINKVLFFETSERGIDAHTADDEFVVKYKLYELEEILPSYFMRVSKSTILNTRKIYSLTKNLTASSKVEFQNSHKKVYVSRNYYKLLKYKLDYPA